MRILYVAKHNSGDNDDEGSIAHALEKLGHEVVKVHELRRHRTPEQSACLVTSNRYDFCLFHKWETVSEVAALQCPAVFWYFDLISNDDDPSLAGRMQVRRKWFWEVIPHCTAAFLTDGDWVSRDHDPHNTEMRRKLHWLMQGADERYVGLGTPLDSRSNIQYSEILFTGTRHHGQKRVDHINQLQQRYGSRFQVLGERGPGHRLHGRALADYFARVKVVVAPDGPCTDRYWSNRVYLTAGLGGCLLHPLCTGIMSLHQYSAGDLQFYATRADLNSLIDYYLRDDQQRQHMREKGLKATIERNLYRHRCQELVAKMEKLL